MQERARVPAGAPDARWLAYVMHLTFFLLLGSAMIRFVQRHGDDMNGPEVIVLAVLLALLYVAGASGGGPAIPRLPMPWPSAWRLVWLAGLVGVWAVLVSLAPSFAWVSVPLIFAALRTLPPPTAYLLIGALTVFVIMAQLKLANRFDLDLLVGPAAVASFATVVFVSMQRQAAHQRHLIDDLIRTRRELAATERRAGTLAERQRLSMEIHDSLAQGLSSQRMLLQAAERTWDTDQGKARGHVRTASSIAEHNLAEARRFVHDLAPADLARDDGLPEALRTLAARESEGGITVRVHIDDPAHTPLPEPVQSALLRITQGALANVREHAEAATAALTLTVLEDQVVLDVADDGRGFDPTDLPGAARGVRGHGLPAVQARLRQLGGTLTVESAPGEGTVLSAAIPLEPPP